jgi:hypothetical protein
MLENGQYGTSVLIEQLSNAVVSSVCPCGCASFDLHVDGYPRSAEPGISIVADFMWDDADGNEMGIFVFTRGGVLAGVEVSDYTGSGDALTLPDPRNLRPSDVNL